MATTMNIDKEPEPYIPWCAYCSQPKKDCINTRLRMNPALYTTKWERHVKRMCGECRERLTGRWKPAK